MARKSTAQREKSEIPTHTTPSPFARCFDDQHGAEHQVAAFDGYRFAERLLEGVIFHATLLGDGRLEVKVSPKSEAYFRQFNMDDWTLDALEYAVGNDVFMGVNADGSPNNNLELSFKDLYPQP